MRYEAVGSLNPVDGPPTLCPGGPNRLTGELAPRFWGASCDALLRRAGSLWSRSTVPGGVLVKSRLPELGEEVGRFDVESIEATPEDTLQRTSRRRVKFESIEFNRRFIATVPSEHDPVALRELFSPGFLEWTVSIDRPVDFGAADAQLYFLWRLSERSRAELERALGHAGELFARLHRELVEAGAPVVQPGPANAGLEWFAFEREDGTADRAGHLGEGGIARTANDNASQASS